MSNPLGGWVQRAVTGRALVSARETRTSVQPEKRRNLMSKKPDPSRSQAAIAAARRAAAAYRTNRETLEPIIRLLADALALAALVRGRNPAAAAAARTSEGASL